MDPSGTEMMGVSASIGRLKPGNCIAKSAMGTNLATSGGGATDGIIAFFEARVRGGAGTPEPRPQ